jgi:hypothetical protein
MKKFKKTIPLIVCFLCFYFGTAFPGQDTSIKSAVQGNVDMVVIKGDRLLIRGWAGAAESGAKLISISIWCADTLVYEGEGEQFERPDVAKAMKRNDWLKSGWRINAGFPNKYKKCEHQIKVLAKLDDGRESELPIQKKPILDIIRNYHISFFSEGVLILLAQLSLLLFVFFVEKVLPASKKQKVQTIMDTDSKTKEEDWFYRIFFFVIVFAGGKLLFMKFVGVAYINLLAAVFAVICAFVITPKPIYVDSCPIIRQGNWKNLLLIAGVLFYLGWIYARGVTLPAHDPIAVPTFASILNKNIPLYNYYSHDESGAIFYPPGFPLLLSAGYVFFDHVWILLLFKILCILAIGLIPFSWSWLAKSVFKIPLPLSTIAIAFYIAGFGIERTLSYALPFAGKNSQLFLLSIFPLFFVYLIKVPYRNLLQLVVLGFSFYCLILFHYSTLYLSFVLFLAIFFFWYLSEPKKLFEIIRHGLFVGFVGVIGVICFSIFSNEAIHGLRRTFSGGMYNLSTALTAFVEIMFGADNRFLAIFNTKAFQIVGSPIRGYFLIGCVLFSTLVMVKTKSQEKGKSARPIFLCSATLYLAIVIGAVLGSGLIPVGLNTDFYRWFIFPIQIGVIACALLSAYVLLENIKRWVVIALFLIFLLVPLWVLNTDTIRIKKGVDGCAVSSSQLLEIRDIIVSGPSGCGILSPNVIVTKNLTFVQKYRVIEYAEMLTGCRLLAGSWVHAPSSGWRESDGLPKDEVFKYIPFGMNLYFVGTRVELENYKKTSCWDEIGFLSSTKTPIWKMKATEK